MSVGSLVRERAGWIIRTEGGSTIPAWWVRDDAVSATESPTISRIRSSSNRSGSDCAEGAVSAAGRFVTGSSMSAAAVAASQSMARGVDRSWTADSSWAASAGPEPECGWGVAAPKAGRTVATGGGAGGVPGEHAPVASMLRGLVTRSSPGLRPTDASQDSSADARTARYPGQPMSAGIRNQSSDRSPRATGCWRARFRRVARLPWAEGACDETIRVHRPVPYRLLQIVARLHRFLTCPAGLDTSAKPNRPDPLQTGVRRVFTGIRAECPSGRCVESSPYVSRSRREWVRGGRRLPVLFSTVAFQANGARACFT